MIELEKTYLAKTLPDNLTDYKFKEITDIYIPKTSRHPTLRLRKNGEQYELTKKTPIDKDPSRQQEDTINLTEEEFNTLKNIDGKKLRKKRYYYLHNGRTAEIDIFQDELEGLVVIDFEFTLVEEKDSFNMPYFCLADITKEEFIAGGMVCGKRYEEIEDKLIKFGYKKLSLQK